MRSLALVASLLAVPAHSAPPAKSGDVLLDRCLAHSPQTAIGVSHVHDCYRAAQTRVDAALAAERRVMVGKLRADRVSQTTLAAGEAAWASYRDRWCAFEATAERDPGSREATGLECRVELSQAHLTRLKGAY
jgi:uncharacterized protein YecT (DUF1311 family)